jgi:hypothetical protein
VFLFVLADVAAEGLLELLPLFQLAFISVQIILGRFNFCYFSYN